MTDRSERSIAGAWATTLARHVGLVLVALAWTALAARSLGTEGTGRVILAATLPALLGPILNLGLPYSLAWLAAQRRFGEDALRGSALVLGWAVGVSAGAAAIGLSLLVGAAADVDVGLYAVGLTALPSALAISIAGSLYQGYERFGIHAVTLVAPPLTALIATSLDVWFGTAGEVEFVVYWSASYLLTALVLSVAIAHGGRLPAAGELRAISTESLSFGWKLWVSEGAVSARSRLDIYLLGGLIGAGAAGLYGAAGRMAAQIGIISQAANFVVFPMIARKGAKEEERRMLTPLVARLSFAASIVAALGLVVVGRPLIDGLLGGEFAGAYAPMLWYLPAVALLSVSRVLTADISARGHPAVIMRIALFTLGVNIVLNLVLIPPLGANGAAIAASATAVVNLWWRMVAYRRIVGSPFGSALVPTISDLKMLVSWKRRS